MIQTAAAALIRVINVFINVEVNMAAERPLNKHGYTFIQSQITIYSY